MKTQKTNSEKVNVTKKIVNLTDKATNDKFIEAKKESIKKGIDFNNLDFQNLLNATSQIRVEKVKNVNEKHFIYKFERDNLDSQKAQSKRTKIRKQIANKIDNIIFYFNDKNEVELKKSIEDFKQFYLETYILNDYTLNSIYANHVEQIKKDKLNLVFQIIKLV
jgi:hypothetical protein